MSKNVSVPVEETVLPRQRTCGTMPVHERLLRTNPAYVKARADSENRHHAYLRRGPMQERAGVTVIPVVVHVVYKTSQQNISDAQIQSQIDVLNHDYRKTNADISSVPSVFAGLAADARVEFELATADPAGNPTNGITRTQTNASSFSDDDKVKSASTGGADAWPADRFLNIWVCQLGGGLLGYAQFPGGPAATDGVVILHSGFGTTGTAAAPFNLGRSATHEIGHWLNLRHIWGDDGTGCNGSDFVDDTPNQAGPNFDTPAFPHVTCNNGPNGDLFMDYMDYVDDDAMFMFTAGQVDRMQACLDGDRSTIGHMKPGPTMKFIDDPHGGSIKFRDDVPTFKFRDDLMPHTLPQLDLVATLPHVDQLQTLKNLDDVKIPAMDISAKFITDQTVFPQGGGYPPEQPGFTPQAGGLRRGVPFVLSTPHHSSAWMKTFPGAAKGTIDAYVQQLIQYEQALYAYARSEEAGRLSAEDRLQADRLYQDYIALSEEYQQLVGS